MDCKRLTLFAGHYGSGKTNIALNYAFRLKEAGKPVTIADLDIVNPYFRVKDSEALLEKALPGLCRLLKPGGCVAMSFNAQTFRRDRLAALMAGAGLTPLTGGPYEGFEHWVEQAITRDIAVARKDP